jgi:hypothetical protein
MFEHKKERVWGRMTRRGFAHQATKQSARDRLVHMETLELGCLLSKDTEGFFTSVLELRLTQSDKTDLVAFLRVL